MEPGEASGSRCEPAPRRHFHPWPGFALPRGGGWLAQPQESVGLPGSWSTSVPRTGLSQV